MTAREQERGMVLNQVERGELTGRQGAELVGLSLRHVRRLLAAYRREGVAALAHGNRGRGPVHALPEETRKRVVALAQGRYRGLNHHHLQELLLEREQLALSRSSVWRILTSAGIPSPRRRRPPQHRCRRERYPQEGMLLQVDGSRHDWLQKRGPYLTLVGAYGQPNSTP
jgi:transposase